CAKEENFWTGYYLSVW
nr:immunoglobulin heavy chain junction region [Macaca mulatta]MOW99681.1 immunoglobulin heavy chain junction region [Macaca mulatta]MOX00555.1 immunoglobulin heavy chain junction region [Macaca mulatta]MOX00997.1 immunoglobulin heavy chain junction region [Macaca mulatta]MOX01499.1 immunoglobulin heavy chain junction region [Macaca mulatta]